jgi:hypothetical protein
MKLQAYVITRKLQKTSTQLETFIVSWKVVITMSMYTYTVIMDFCVITV